MNVKVDRDGLIRSVRDSFGLELEPDLADRMCSTIVPALQDLASAQAAFPEARGEPCAFEQALLELAPPRIAEQAAAFDTVAKDSTR